MSNSSSTVCPFWSGSSAVDVRSGWRVLASTGGEDSDFGLQPVARNPRLAPETVRNFLRSRDGSRFAIKDFCGIRFLAARKMSVVAEKNSKKSALRNWITRFADRFHGGG